MEQADYEECFLNDAEKLTRIDMNKASKEMLGEITKSQESNPKKKRKEKKTLEVIPEDTMSENS